MKKILGFTFGGLQRKALFLVLCVLILTVAMYSVINVYQNSRLVQIVDETRTEQQTAISSIASETMQQAVDGSLTKSTDLQAQLADNEFSEVIRNLYILQSIAEGLIENRDTLQMLSVAPPDAASNGESSAYVLCEEGVDPSESEWLGIVAHMSTPMIALHRNSNKIDGCYIGLMDGTFLCVDEKSAEKLDDSGNPISFPVRERPWYTGAIEADGLYFTDLIQDAFSGKYMITCAIPVRADGEIIGVVGIDLVLENMTSFAESTMEGTWSYVMNADGHLVAGTENGVFEQEMADRIDLYASDITGLSEILTLAKEGNTGLQTLTLEGKEYYIVGAPIPTVGWTILNVIDKEMTQQAEQQMLVEYDKINDTATARFEADMRSITRQGFLMLGIVVLASLLIAYLATREMVKPIEKMTKAIRSSQGNGQLFEMQDAFRTNDEIELLAESFAEQSKKTRQYIDEITQVTAEKERIGTELELANTIQSGMIPHVFPPFPDRKEIDLFASMDPAKEVGGDFYDFFLIDNDHLGLVIADVSGKGIPAALFMMASKIILQSVAMLGRSPREILTKTNEAICSNNQAEMFVTAWIGILELSTGKLTAANAGHEYPVIRQPDGTFTLYKDKHGLVLGGMEGMKYTEYELQLRPGSKIFLYTDGVPEATNSSQELFGTKRMLEALNTDPGASSEQLLKNVRAAVDAFVDGAEQFDDLTMLGMEYRGNAENTNDTTPEENAEGSNSDDH